MTRIVLVLAVILAAALPVPCSADLILFTDRAAFQSAAPPLQVIDFEGLVTDSGYIGYGTEDGVTLQGVQFLGVTDSYPYLHVIAPVWSPEYYEWNSGAILVGPPTLIDAAARIEVHLPAGVLAVGADIMTAGEFGMPMQVTLSGGQTFMVDTFNIPDRAFVGFISDSPISSLSFVADQGAFPMMDNFSFAPLAVPEPASILLGCVGTLGLLAGRFGRRGSKCVSV